MWNNTNTVLDDANIVEKAVDTSEGGFPTNRYIGDASLRYK